jgi:hypothetical protein
MNIHLFVKGSVGAVLALGLATSLAHAESKSATASPCKGLEQKACGGKSECSWIAATKRKDGRQVKAYCRHKPKKSAAAATK